MNITDRPLDSDDAEGTTHLLSEDRVPLTPDDEEYQEEDYTELDFNEEDDDEYDYDPFEEDYDDSVEDEEDLDEVPF